MSFLGRAKQRDSFAILEGVHKGQRASVSQKSETTSFLSKTIKHLPAGRVEFDLRTQTLKYGNLGPFNAFSGGGVRGFTPVPVGNYDLAIPAFPTAQTRAAYGRWTRFHRTWFRIGTNLNGSRFLHPGQISDGCVTIRQFIYTGKPGSTLPDGFGDLATAAATSDRALIGLPVPERAAPILGYDDIYRYLILRRASNQSVGKLIVTNSRPRPHVRAPARGAR